MTTCVSHLRSTFVVLLFVVGCHSTTAVERSNWAVTNGMRGTLSVRMHDGSAFQLDSFSFTNAGLVGIRGTREIPKQSKSSLANPVTIQYDSISVVQLRHVDRQKTLLALAAAAAASYIVIAQLQSGERPAAVEQPPVTSCPFIYSYDGKSYTMDSETYSGAITKGLERADVDNLDHLRAVDGRYRMILANEADETEYTDELALLVAEHPLGTQVFPDASGALHVVRNATAPLSFREHHQVSLPATKTWEATFRRPSGKRFAVVVRVRNTDAVPFVHTHLMNLLGNDVYSWYHNVNTDPRASERVSAWYSEMAGLRVSTATPNGWRKQAVLPVVGPIVSKTIVAPIELSGSDDLVRVRLESSPMLWRIESISLVSDEGPAETHELRITRATEADGTDVTERLRDRDGNYNVTMKGSRVAVEFDAIQPKPGMRQTMLARTTGHYYIESNDERKGNSALVSRLMTTGTFSQGYFMLKYSQRKRAAGTE